MLINLEEKFHLLFEDFKDASLYAVHYIRKTNAPSLNLFNLYGDGGEKFMAGGVLVRRAKNWVVAGKNLSS